MIETEINEFIRQNMQFRAELDTVRSDLAGSNRKSRERSLAITKIEEAIMWLEMNLKALGLDGTLKVKAGIYMNEKGEVIDGRP